MATPRRPFIRVETSLFREPWERDVKLTELFLMGFLCDRWARDRLTAEEANHAVLSPSQLHDITGRAQLVHARGALRKLAEVVTLTITERGVFTEIYWPKYSIIQDLPSRGRENSTQRTPRSAPAPSPAPEEENSNLDAGASKGSQRPKKTLADFPEDHVAIGRALLKAIPKSILGQPIPGEEDLIFFKWLAQIRLLLTVDNSLNAGGKWTAALVLDVIDWLPTHEGSDGFRWGEQILSGGKLRKKFPKLLLAKGKTSGRQTSTDQWKQMREDEANQGVEEGVNF